MNISIIGGTTKSPKGAGLCETCAYAHVTRGDAISDEQVYCSTRFENVNPIPVRRPISECTSYLKRGLVDKNQFEKEAWILRSDGHGHLKFVPPG